MSVPYTFKITVKEDHIYCECSGIDSYDATKVYMTKFKEACDKHELYNVLVISDMTPKSTIDGYKVLDIFTELNFTHKYRIACVDKNLETEKTDRFIETVLKNRGLVNCHVFSYDKLETAKRWLFDRISPE